MEQNLEQLISVIRNANKNKDLSEILVTCNDGSTARYIKIDDTDRYEMIIGFNP